MKRFARGALTLAFWLTVWAALALLVHHELVIDLFHNFDSLSNKFAPPGSYSGRMQDSLLPIIQYL